MLNVDNLDLSYFKCIISGGNYTPAPEKEHAPKIIMNGLVSVRQSKTGRGSALRVFVDVKKHICYAEICKSKYSTLSRDQLESLWCEHLKEGSTATSNAKCVDIDLESFSELNLDIGTMDLLVSGSKNRCIRTYIINSKTTVLDLLVVALLY